MKKILYFLLLQLNTYLSLGQTNNFILDRGIPFVAKNKWGWADLYTNKILIEPIYDSVCPDYSGNLRVFKNGKVGLVKCDGGNNCFESIPTEYDEISLDFEGYVTSIHGKKGFLNLKHEKIIDNLYDTILFDRNYVFLFLINKEKYKSGVFDIKTNELIIPFDYEIIRINPNKLVARYKDFEEHGLIKDYIFQGMNGEYYFFNRNRALQEFILNDDSLFQEIIRNEEGIRIKEQGILTDFTKIVPDNYFIIGNGGKDNKFKIGKVKLFNANKYFGDYLIVQNKRKDKYGLINVKTDSIILNTEYDDIKTLRFLGDKFVVAYDDIKFLSYSRNEFFVAIKNQKQILLYNDKKVSENEYDEIYCDGNGLVLKRNGLFGIVFINRIILGNEEEKVSFVVFEPKYTRFNYSGYSNPDKGVSVLKVTSIENENYYISNKGFEYKK